MKFYSRNRFAILLAVLTGLLVGPPLFIDWGMPSKLLDGTLSVMVLAAVVSLCSEPRQRAFALIFGLPTVAFTAGGLALSGNPGTVALLLGHLSSVIFLFGAAALIVRSLFATTSITFDRILGAVCGYLFLGLGWAMLYGVIEDFRPGSFEAGESVVQHWDRNGPAPQSLIYFSFVTLTTVGFGDIVPATSATRTLAWLEAICGQFYLAVIVASLVGMFGPVGRPGADESVEVNTKRTSAAT